MEADIRRRLSRAVRARDFAEAHPVSDPSFTTVLNRLSAGVSKADAIAMQEGEGKLGERAAIARRRDLRLSIRRGQLTRLVKIAELAAETRPELAGQFVLPPLGMPNKPFLLAARSLLAAAIPQKDLFVSLGIGEAFIEELTQVLDQLEGATTSAHNGRSGHVTARADLANLMRQCGRDVTVLGTFYKTTLPKSSEILAGWETAKNVPGPFTHHQPDTPPAPGSAQATS